MQLGLHLPTDGAVPLYHNTAHALGATCFLVISDAHNPDDVARYAQTVIVRLPNPQPGETAGTWLNRVRPRAEFWSTMFPPGMVIYQIGNEPDTEGYDLDTPWEIEAWKGAHRGYRDILRATIPGPAILTTPFTVANTALVDSAYVDGYEGIAGHAYVWAHKPEDITDPHAGASWRHLVQFDKPVYLTEVNSNPTDPAAIVRLLRSIDSPLVEGACLYIAAPSHDEVNRYEILPDHGMEIARLWAIQPVPIPEEGYSASSRFVDTLHPATMFRDQWIAAISRRNPDEAQMIVDAYQRNGIAAGIKVDLALAQGADESAWFGHPRWRVNRNPAGIGITGDAVIGVDFGSIERGVQSHIALLCCYGMARTPDIVSSWNALAPYGYGGFQRNAPTVGDLDGHWAVPGVGYGATIAEIANEVIGSDAPPLPAPDPVPIPTDHYEIVIPVDCAVDQGSDGSFSHGGHSSGFFAIDYDCGIGVPVRAVADGIVGVTYWQDSNPISLRTGHSIWIDHDNGYSTFSCHLSRFDVATGERVVQGQTIGLTGDPREPGNGFGSGPHIHWEIWDTSRHVRIKMEDLLAAGIAGPWTGEPKEDRDMRVDGHMDWGKYTRQWHGPNWNPKTGKPKSTAIPLNPQAGAFLTWQGEFDAGKPLGFATSREEYAPNGLRMIQYFSNGNIEGNKDPDTGEWTFWCN